MSRHIEYLTRLVTHAEPAEYAGIPVWILNDLIRYLETGSVPSSDFLRAVLKGDLFKAFAHADDDNARNMGTLVRLLYNHVPSDAVGSAEAVERFSQMLKGPTVTGDEILRDLQDYGQFLADHVDGGGGAIVLLETGSDMYCTPLAGGCIVHDGVLIGLRVATAYRGRGIGRRLVERAKEYGNGRLTVQCKESLIPFYEKSNFHWVSTDENGLVTMRYHA